MVKGFRYKLYSTVSDSDQLKKEEKVIFIVIALLLGRSITIKLFTWQKKETNFLFNLFRPQEEIFRVNPEAEFQG